MFYPTHSNTRHPGKPSSDDGLLRNAVHRKPLLNMIWNDAFIERVRVRVPGRAAGLWPWPRCHVAPSDQIPIYNLVGWYFIERTFPAKPKRACLVFFSICLSYPFRTLKQPGTTLVSTVIALYSYQFLHLRLPIPPYTFEYTITISDIIYFILTALVNRGACHGSHPASTSRKPVYDTSITYGCWLGITTGKKRTCAKREGAICRSIARCGSGAIKICAKSKQWEELLDGKSMVPEGSQCHLWEKAGMGVVIRREACAVTMVAIL